MAGSPDVLVLVIAFWCVHEPRRVGLLTAFVFGLLLDVHDAGLLGGHALSYTLTGLRAIALHRRLQRFDLWSQAMHMPPVFFLAQLVTQIILAWLAGKWPGWQWAVSVGLTVAIWPLAGWVLHMPQRRYDDVESSAVWIRADACSNSRKPASSRSSAFACAPGWAACSRWPASACVGGPVLVPAGRPLRGVFRAGGQEPYRRRAHPRRGEARSWTATAKSWRATIAPIPWRSAGPGRQPGPAVRSPGAGRVHHPSDQRRFKRRVGESSRYASLAAAQQPQRHRGRLVLGAFVRVPGRRAACALGARISAGRAAAHVVGFIGRIAENDIEELDKAGQLGNYRGTDVIGKKGIEKTWEAALHGRTGLEEVEVTAGGRPMRTLRRIDPVPGSDIMLSIDLELQKLAEQAFEGRRGALVALDPDTGEVLAFVSQPSFDPNLFVDGIDVENWRRLNESP